MGWGQFDEDTHNDLFIGVIRDPIEWMASLGRTPHGLHRPQDETWDHFLLSPTVTYRINFFKPNENFTKQIVLRDRNFLSSGIFPSQPKPKPTLILTSTSTSTSNSFENFVNAYHPNHTGGNYSIWSNLFELRKIKSQWLFNDLPYLGRHVILVRYEDLNRHWELFLKFISLKFCLNSRHQDYNGNNIFHNWGFYKSEKSQNFTEEKIQATKKKKKNIFSSISQNIMKNIIIPGIDWNIEEQWGYKRSTWEMKIHNFTTIETKRNGQPLTITTGTKTKTQTLKDTRKTIPMDKDNHRNTKKKEIKKNMGI
jgi:hypothetical protein